MKEKWLNIWQRYNTTCSWLLVIVSLLIAYMVCAVILHFTWIDNDAPIVFVLAVVAISRMTYHIYYGVTASLISSFAVNYFFTYPYNYFTLNIVGYPIDFVCFTCADFFRVREKRAGYGKNRN